MSDEARLEIDLSTQAGIRALADLVAAANKATAAEEAVGAAGKRLGHEVGEGAQAAVGEIRNMHDAMNRLVGMQRVELLNNLRDGFRELAGAARDFYSELDGKATGVAAYAKTIERLGFAYGMTADKLQAAARVQDMAGGGGIVGFDQMVRGIGTRMERYLSMQEGGSESGGRNGIFFKQLGVDLERGGKRRTAPDVTTDILDKLSKVSDQSRALNVAETLLGDSGRTLVLIARQRGETYSQMVDRMAKYNVLSKDQIHTTAELHTATKELERRQKQLNELLAADDAPLLTALKTKFAELLTEVIKNHKEMLLFYDLVTDVGGPAIRAGGGILQIVLALKLLIPELTGAKIGASLWAVAINPATWGVAFVLVALGALVSKWGEVKVAQDHARRSADDYRDSLKKLVDEGRITEQQYKDVVGPPEPSTIDRVRARMALAAGNVPVVGLKNPLLAASVERVRVYDAWASDPSKGHLPMGSIKPSLPKPKAVELNDIGGGLSDDDKRKQALEAKQVEVAKLEAQKAQWEARNLRHDVLPGAYANGAKVGGFSIAGVLSQAPIHYGTHGEPGTFDIGGKQLRASGRPLADIQRDLAAMGLVVAWRKPGDPGITNEHFHIADPRLSPKEAARIRGQRRVLAGSAGGGWPGEASLLSARRELAQLGGPQAMAQFSKAQADEDKQRQESETADYIAKLEAAIAAPELLPALKMDLPGAKQELRRAKLVQAQRQGEGADWAERARQSQEAKADADKAKQDKLKEFTDAAEAQAIQARMARNAGEARRFKAEEANILAKQLEYLRASQATQLEILQTAEKLKQVREEINDIGRIKFDVLAASAGGDEGLKRFMAARGSGAGYVPLSLVPSAAQRDAAAGVGTVHPLGRADMMDAAVKGMVEGGRQAAADIARSTREAMAQAGRDAAQAIGAGGPM